MCYGLMDMDQLTFSYRCHSTGSFDNTVAGPPASGAPASVEVEGPAARTTYPTPELLCRPLDVPVPLSYGSQGTQPCPVGVSSQSAYQTVALSGVSPSCTPTNERSALCAADTFYGSPSGCIDPKDALDAWRVMPYASLYYYPYDVPGYSLAAGYGVDLNGVRRKNATRETTSTLKAWLNEHRKNPYPTKGEKIMLAIITKMTLTQVSTWFANARRRLKKENKMTWEPRNLCDEDCDDVSGDEDDYKTMKSKKHEGSSPIPAKDSTGNSVLRGDLTDPTNIKSSDHTKSDTKPRIWSIVDMATSSRKDVGRTDVRCSNSMNCSGISGPFLDASCFRGQISKPNLLFDPASVLSTGGYGGSVPHFSSCRPSPSNIFRPESNNRTFAYSAAKHNPTITSADSYSQSQSTQKPRSFNINRAHSAHQKIVLNESPDAELKPGDSGTTTAVSSGTISD